MNITQLKAKILSLSTLANQLDPDIASREQQLSKLSAYTKQFLLFFVLVPIAFQFPHYEFGVFKKGFDDPFDLTSFGEFGETGYCFIVAHFF